VTFNCKTFDGQISYVFPYIDLLNATINGRLNEAIHYNEYSSSLLKLLQPTKRTKTINERETLQY